ncbi:YdcF family protein [Carnimonas nigrificans]|uniref:YdcF family protein n=1 Tax=Carnimonas nigrificans TaxID=64323 RepID=UPI000472CCD5|nr:YdcF family protein [Carnimonas nigrificans]
MTTTTLLAVFKALIFPPGGVIVGLAMATLIARGWPRVGITLAVMIGAAFLILCIPRVSLWLSAPIERITPAAPAQWSNAGAIVVLGGGRAAASSRSPERINLDSFARVAEAARIARITHLPILLTGGAPGGERASEAQLMAQALSDSFAQQPRWLENDSRNTAENACYSAAILKERGIETVVLVTTAFHMARAQRDFERAGIKVIAAPTGFSSAPPGLLGWLPSTLGLAQSQRALHEAVGWLAGR